MQDNTTDKELVLQAMREYGRSKAAELLERAAGFVCRSTAGRVVRLLNNLDEFKTRYKETLEELKEADRRQYNQLNDHEHRITQLEAKCKERDDT